MKRMELEAKTKTELLALARRIDLPGRSQMSKDELVTALIHRIPPTRSSARKIAGKQAATKKRTAGKPVAQKKVAARKSAQKKVVTRKPAPLVKDSVAAPASPAGSTAAARLPEKYGEDYVGLMVRDPYWLHVYWEVTPETLTATRRGLGGQGPQSRLVLRLYNYPPQSDVADLSADAATSYGDIDLPEDATGWYVQVARAAQLYGVAIGLRTGSGTFRACVSSNIVQTPPGGCSAESGERWTAQNGLLTRLTEMLENGGVPGSSPALGLPPYQRPGGEALARRSPRRRKRS